MPSLDGTITFQSGEYRPCIVDEKRALFHRWIDKDQIILKTGFVLKHEHAEAIRQRFEKDFIVPSGMTAEKTRVTLGIVEFEDGTIQEVLPTRIKFLDGGIIFHENDIFYKTKE